MAHTIQIFMSVLIVMLVLAVFIPIFNEVVDGDFNTDRATGFETTVTSSTPFTIILNIVGIAFWTFGLNSWINVLILLPLRVVGLIALWFIISPAK